MKSLTVKQPFAQWLVEGIKHSEHRSRNTKIRGDIVIHSSRSPDMNFMDEWGLNASYFKHGFLLGIVDIFDSVDLGNGIFAWRAKNPRIFKDQIPYCGKLSFWEIDDEIIKKCLRG